MAFLGGLLSSALPYLGRALTGAIGGVSSAIQRGGGIGDVLKGAGLGALQGVVGQPDPTPRIEPTPVHNAPSAEPQQAQPVRRPRISIPQMLHRKAKKKKHGKKR